MMFTPLFFVRKTYTWSLLALSVALLVRWEITFFLHPERFSEETNDYLQCRNQAAEETVSPLTGYVRFRRRNSSIHRPEQINTTYRTGNAASPVFGTGFTTVIVVSAVPSAKMNSARCSPGARASR